MFTSGMALKTAVTDLLNAFVAMMLIFSLHRHNPLTRHHQLWINAFIAFTFVSLAGFVLHGFNISEALLKPLWCIMFWCLNYMLASYVVAVKYDIDGDKGTNRFRKIIVIITVLFSLFLNATVFLLEGNGPFMAFSCYNVLCMTYIIVRLIRNVKACKSFLWYLVAIAFLITGSILQTIEGLEITLIWSFNRDCIYHFMTCIFVLLQYTGVMKYKASQYKP